MASENLMFQLREAIADGKKAPLFFTDAVKIEHQELIGAPVETVLLSGYVDLKTTRRRFEAVLQLSGARSTWVELGN